MTLSGKQARFVEEYLIDLNASKAALRAGYSEKTAAQIGAENLFKPAIQEAVQNAIKKRSQRVELTQDDIINELRAVAFTRLKDVCEWDEAGIRYKASDDIVNDAGVESIEDSRLIKSGGNSKDGGEDQVLISNITLKRTKDKVKALELLGKHLGMFTDKLKISGDPSAPLMPVQIEFVRPDDQS